MVSLGRTPESREKSRAFLQAVYDNDGRAGTSEIRRATGLSRGDMQYRYETLEDSGLITIEYDTSVVSGANESAPKVAVLTDAAYGEIEKGLLQGEQYNPKGALPEDAEAMAHEIVELVERVDSQEEAIEQVQQYVSQNVYRQLSMLRWSVARIEKALEGTQWIDLDSVEAVEGKEAELKERSKDFDVQA